MHGSLSRARVRSVKLARLLRHGSAWPIVRSGLRNRVFPSFEHEGVHFGAQFATVIDAGTSRGQFALFALWRFPCARLICFEPLPEAGAVASQVLPADRVVVHKVALGAARGSVALHVSSQDDSSSLLPIGQRQVDAHPGTEEIRQVTVPVDVLETYLADPVLRRPCLLKIDVQGAELDVLRGAGESLELVDEVLVEVSFVELYEGQPLAGEVVAYLAARGFALVDLTGLTRAKTGAALQADFLFRRSTGTAPAVEARQ